MEEPNIHLEVPNNLLEESRSAEPCPNILLEGSILDQPAATILLEESKEHNKSYSSPLQSKIGRCDKCDIAVMVKFFLMYAYSK